MVCSLRADVDGYHIADGHIMVCTVQFSHDGEWMVESLLSGV